jgi:hypothetical protein
VEVGRPDVVEICSVNRALGFPLRPNRPFRAGRGRLTTSQSEQALSLLVVPDLDLVIVSPGNEDGLGRMERDSTNRTCPTTRHDESEQARSCQDDIQLTIVLIVTVDQGSHLVVP